MMKPILVLGLGNDLLGDDAAGILAVRALQEELAGKADVVETALHGLALLDLFLGYERAIIIDAIHTRAHPPGTILELHPEDLPAVETPSPHYTGLPEMLVLADQLQLDFPQEIIIFALEVIDPYTMGADLTPPVRAALPEVIRRVKEQVDEWAERKDSL